MQNIFENPAFSMTALTTAINLLPNNCFRQSRSASVRSQSKKRTAC
jgi:hypothetical protein